MGDFNLAEIVWNSFTDLDRGTCCASALLDMAFLINLTQIVKEPTRIQESSKSILDLVFITERLLLLRYNIRVIPGIFDHKMVHFIFLLNKQVAARDDQHFTFNDFYRSNDKGISHKVSYYLDEFAKQGIDPATTTNAFWLIYQKIIFNWLAEYLPR